MPDIYGSHFEYAGQSSRRYKLILANVETERNRLLAGTFEGVSMFNKKTKQKYIVDNNYSESPMSFEVDIITDDESVIKRSEKSDLERWLFNKHSFQKFYVDLADDLNQESFEYVGDEMKRLYLNCRFVNPSVLEYHGGIVGYRATLETDSGYWWQDETVCEFTLNNQTDSSYTDITVHVDSVIDDYTYPRIALLMSRRGGDMSLSIANFSDDRLRTMEMTGLASGSTITINSEINYVSSPCFQNLVKPNFPRLVNGDNTIRVTGQVVGMTVQFHNRRPW